MLIKENEIILEEKNQLNAIAKEFDRLPAFTEFPYTHGDVLEQRRQSMRHQLNTELKEVLEA